MQELMPDYHIPPGLTVLPLEVLVVVPFVNGMLREATMDALHQADQAYVTYPIPADDPYQYAAYFRLWWRLPIDLVILEQDMVPTAEQFHQLIHHPDPWVAMPYHVGDGQYATGLGFCKIAKSLRERHPDAGVNISLDPRNSRDLIGYVSLNENVERHLTRLGETQTVIDSTVAHLHYPEYGDG